MRLDQALVTRGLVDSRTRAQRLIRAGRVSVGGAVSRKPALEVDDATALSVDDDHYVSRAAHKLIGALDDSGLAVPRRCLDAGASTGGFTQVLLERGAVQVYAVDVGHDQLAAVLRADPRVGVHEGVNLRDLTLEHVGGAPVDLVVADVSFISLTLLIEPLSSVAAADADLLLMVKPQFEVGPERLGKGGVVRTDDDRAAAVHGVVRAAESQGWTCVWQGISRLPGPAGNVEFFVHLRRSVTLRP